MTLKIETVMPRLRPNPVLTMIHFDKKETGDCQAVSIPSFRVHGWEIYFWTGKKGQCNVRTFEALPTGEQQEEQCKTRYYALQQA